MTGDTYTHIGPLNMDATIQSRISDASIFFSELFGDKNRYT